MEKGNGKKSIDNILKYDANEISKYEKLKWAKNIHDRILE